MRPIIQKTGYLLAALGLLACLWPQGKAHACGISLSEPKSFYDGVDFQGHVHLINKLGNLQAGKAEIPIFLILNSGNGYASPYSGPLDIPLLSARMEQVDENTFLLRSPTGWLLPFVRNSKDKNILDGSNGMKALIDEAKGTITAWADCGDKITFSKGRILQFQTKDVKLDYVYSGDRVSEIREGGQTLLKVNSDPNTGEVTGLSLGLKRDINFSWGQRPIVQIIQGKPLLLGMRKTLTKIALPDGTEKNFEFAVNDQMQPALKIDGMQEVSWNPETLLADKVGEWTYDIKPGEARFSNAAIGRKTASGLTEFWHYDSSKGEEIVRGVDGVKRVTSWFTSGKLAGKVRSVKVSKLGSWSNYVKYTYSESGALMRAFKEFSLDKQEAVWRSDESSKNQRVFITTSKDLYSSSGQLLQTITKYENNHNR